MDLALSDLQAATYGGGLVKVASASVSCRSLFFPSAHLLNMDIRYNHGSPIHCLRASHTQDASDLLAIGGEHSIAILRVVSCPER